MQAILIKKKNCEQWTKFVRNVNCWLNVLLFIPVAWLLFCARLFEIRRLYRASGTYWMKRVEIWSHSLNAVIMKVYYELNQLTNFLSHWMLCLLCQTFWTFDTRTQFIFYRTNFNYWNWVNGIKFQVIKLCKYMSMFGDVRLT